MSIKYFVKQKLFSELLTNLDYGLFVLDDQMRYVYANDAFVNMMDIKKDKIIGQSIGIYNQKEMPIDIKIHLDEIINNLLLKKFHHGVLNISFDKNNPLNVSIKIYSINAAGGVYFAGMISEEAAGKLEMLPAEKELQHFDLITQLPLKQYFMVQLSDLLIDSIKELAIVRIDIDRFRMLKSNYSEKSMNHIMLEFVQRIYGFKFNELRSFSRFNDESFAMVFELDKAMAVRDYLDKIMQLTEKPYIVGDNTVYLHFSMGVSSYPIDGTQADLLLDNAEKALHYAKEKGGDDIYWYDAKQLQVSAEKLQLETEIRNAFLNNEFVPVYQPKVDMKTFEIVGFEALVRWNHPRLGFLSPAYFLEAVIEYKLNFDLFCFMAEQVVKHLYIWQLREMKQTLCINADSYDFLHPNFIGFMTQLLERYPVTEGSLHVEVTETSLIQQYDVDVLAQFKKLKQLGVSIALDDFGTGYASISYLRHYPFDYIKIDKSFIEDIQTNDKQLLIVRAIIDLASALDLYTVAEGIETVDHYDITADMGCIHGQGYLFSKAMTYTEATKLIASSSEGPLTVLPHADSIIRGVRELKKTEFKNATKIKREKNPPLLEDNVKPTSKKQITINSVSQQAKKQGVAEMATVINPNYKKLVRTITPEGMPQPQKRDMKKTLEDDFDKALTQIPISEGEDAIKNK